MFFMLTLSSRTLSARREVIKTNVERDPNPIADANNQFLSFDDSLASKKFAKLYCCLALHLSRIKVPMSSRICAKSSDITCTEEKIK